MRAAAMTQCESILAAVIAVACILAIASPASGQTAAMLAYGTSGSNTPFYRLWNGSDWGSEAAANTIGNVPYWIALRGSPLAQQFAMAVLDAGADIEVQIWDGSAWGSVFQATSDTGTTTTRAFDLAYEQVSGELLLVYRESGTTQVRYRTHNGTNWSAESSYTMCDREPRWLQLVPKPGTDEIMLLASTDVDSNRAAAAIWNGSAFTNRVNGSSEAIATEHLCGAYEQASGQFLAIYGVGTNSPAYATYTGSWGGGSAPSVGGVPRWCRLIVESGSDAILAAVQDSSNDINVVRWSGTAWGSVLEVEASTATSTRRAFDFAFERGGTEALLVYDETSSTLQYRTWDGSAWSSEADGPTNTGSPLQTIQAVTGLTTSQVFVTYCTDTPTIRTVIWDGSSFGSAITLGTSSSPKEYEPFMVAVAGSSQPRIVQWREVEP